MQYTTIFLIFYFFFVSQISLDEYHVIERDLLYWFCATSSTKRLIVLSLSLFCLSQNTLHLHLHIAVRVLFLLFKTTLQLGFCQDVRYRCSLGSILSRIVTNGTFHFWKWKWIRGRWTSYLIYYHLQTADFHALFSDRQKRKYMKYRKFQTN